jgi:hypothetical protein
MSKHRDHAHIANLATRFRAAIETTDKRRLPITFENFPRGSCGDSALLLGHYLIDAGQSPFQYVLGRKGDTSHAWLERDGLLVDITADQFPEIGQPVIVTVNSSWHSDWEAEHLHVADFDIFDPRTRADLGHAYALIIGQDILNRSLPLSPSRRSRIPCR